MSRHELKPAWPPGGDLELSEGELPVRTEPVGKYHAPTQEHYAGAYPQEYERRTRAAFVPKRLRRRWS